MPNDRRTEDTASDRAHADDAPPTYASDYYGGLPSRPRLVAGNQTDRWYYAGRGKELEAGQMPPLKTLRALPEQSPLAQAWDHIIPTLVHLVDQRWMGATCIDGVLLDGREVVWIGVAPEALSYPEAKGLVSDCMTLLDSFRLIDVDVEIREVHISRDSARLRNPDDIHPREVVRVIGSLTTAIGLPITCDAAPNKFGTAGIWLKRQDSPDELYLLTAQHVVAPDAAAEQLPIEGQNGAIVSVYLKEGWEAGLDKEIGKCQKRARARAEGNAGRARRAGNGDEAERIIDRLEPTFKALSDIGNDIRNDWSADLDRVIGRVHAFPKRSIPDTTEYTEDWAVIAVDSARVPSGIKNVLNLRDESNFILAQSTTESMRQGAAPQLAELEEEMLLFSGFVPRGELQNRIPVLKQGASTGLTFGETSGVVSVVRDATANGRYSKELSIVGINNQPFSRSGDSGSAIVDVTGRVVGILNGGAKHGARTDNEQRKCNDLTYATPAYWILDRMELVGLNLTPL